MPEFGLTLVKVGTCGAVTVNVWDPLIPPEVVTVTLSAPSVALLAIVNVAVMAVLLTTATLLTVTPVPVIAIAAPETKFVPVSVTGTVVA